MMRELLVLLGHLEEGLLVCPGIATRALILHLLWRGRIRCYLARLNPGDTGKQGSSA